MSFKYVICLDFEATCWEVRGSEKAEIIEIGALLLNLENGAVESEFHRYVRPTMNPILSDYCVNLTGISQSLIDRQSKFPLVYQAFIEWLNQIGKEKQLHYATPNNRNANAYGNTAFCSWSSWDLGHYFRIDCERNNLKWPPILRAWIDARILFKQVYYPDTGFSNALKIINVQQVGRAHSGIDDAKSLAKMVKNLYDSGVAFDRLTDWRNE